MLTAFLFETFSEVGIKILASHSFNPCKFDFNFTLDQAVDFLALTLVLVVVVFEPFLSCLPALFNGPIHVGIIFL